MQPVNVKLAQRVRVPLSRLRDNQRLGCGRLQPSRMASCFTQRVRREGNGHGSFIIMDGYCHAR